MEKIGRFEVIKELGHGGMGQVYLAHDPDMDRDVAVKVLPRRLTNDPKFQTLFKQEARTIAKLELPGIVPVYEFGKHEGDRYLVMRYMSGGSLGHKMTGKPLPLAGISSIFNRLAPALDEVHHLGIIHRDIKPDNILFDRFGRANLADFGIARMADKILTLSLKGTPPYMSPEQVEVKYKLDWRSDIYSLGVMLFQMLSGRRPYDHENPTTLMLMHIMQPVPDVLSVNPDLPDHAKLIINKAMAKNREDRFQSVKELSRAVASLQKVSTGKGIKSSEESEANSGSTTNVGGAGAVGIGGLIEGLEIKSGEKPKASDAEETFVDTPPNIEIKTPDENYGGSDAPPSEEKNGEDQTKGSLAGRWKWWASGILILILLILGSLTTLEIISNQQTIASTEVVKTPEPATRSPTATNTPQVTSDPTPILANDLPPSNPVEGSKWRLLKYNKNMVYVPGGDFLMGSLSGEEDEQEVHRVILDGFWIDESEVTNSQYIKFLNEEGNRREGGTTWLDLAESPIREWKDVFDVNEAFSDHPVTNVSWYGAKAYCNWFGGELPTEAQWEYAARGPKNSKYPWGNKDPGPCELAQFGSCGGNTVPVGSFEEGASWVGALDMAGNVWEWINDWYGSQYYIGSPPNNPQGPSSGTQKVLKGGAWDKIRFNLRGSDRFATYRNYQDDTIGFRCLLPS